MASLHNAHAKGRFFTSICHYFLGRACQIVKNESRYIKRKRQVHGHAIVSFYAVHGHAISRFFWWLICASTNVQPGGTPGRRVEAKVLQTEAVGMVWVSFPSRVGLLLLLTDKPRDLTHPGPPGEPTGLQGLVYPLASIPCTMVECGGHPVTSLPPQLERKGGLGEAAIKKGFKTFAGNRTIGNRKSATSSPGIAPTPFVVHTHIDWRVWANERIDSHWQDQAEQLPKPVIA
ncbi:uncharacterized protein TRIADDRAFT_55777 [Trichoplax adhaerens]|uniref:Uncharacterized protein n=1 Tax=Trichoplax adhaerens TaxID=10228 RepID=B3RVU3_TRIAD|nr:predicted protein [Trichoplax adhaerens]EDV26057.1 predicted protein [Trichoplax adhaerens]|eukprot:XP_002112090.1 predicted protein [Trichoplax adhaerens]